MLEIGYSFLYPYPDDSLHLLIVIGKASMADNTKYICAMISSWKENSPYIDDSCRLQKGDHPFIRHDSYVAYRETAMFSEEQIKGDKSIECQQASTELVKKIINGAFISRKTPNIYLMFMKRG